MTIHISDEKLIQRIERLAEQEQRQLIEIINRAVQLYEQRGEVSGTSPFLLSIAGLGSSGKSDISERDEEILASEVDATYGWNVDKDAP